jgi:hypothetical protein
MALETEELYSYLKTNGKINSDKEEFDTLLSSNDVYKTRIAKVLKFSSDAPEHLRVQTLSDFENLISGKKKEVGEEELSQPTDQPLETTEATGQVSADTQQGSVIDSAGEPAPTEPTQTFAAPAPQNFMQDASDLKDLRSKASNLLSQSTGGGFFEEPEVVEEDIEVDDPEKPGRKKKEKQKKFSFARKNDPSVDQGPEYGVDQILGYKDNADGTYEIVYFSENEESDYSKDYVTKAKKTANNYTGQVGDAVYNDYIKKSSSTIRNYTGNDDAWNDLNRKTVSLFHGMSAEEETKLKEEIRASNPEWDENSATALVDLALTKHQGQYNLGTIEGLMGEQEVVATADENAPKTFMDVLRGTIKKNKEVQKTQAKSLDGKFNILGGILGRPGEGTFFAGINKRKNRESAEQIVTNNAHVDKIDEDFFNNINVSESAQILSGMGISPKEFLIGNQNDLKRLIANSEYVQNVKLPEVDQFGNPIEYDFAKVKELEAQAKAKAADDLYNKLNEDVAYYMDLKYIEKGIETGKFKQEDLDHMKQIHENNVAGRGYGEMDKGFQADAQWAMNIRRSALNDVTSFYSASAYLKTDDLKSSGALRTADKDSRRLENLNSKIADEESKLDIDKSELDINLQEIKKNNELISNFDKSIKETETELAQYADVVDNQIILKSTDGSAKAAKISEDLTKLNTEVQEISKEIEQYYDVQEDGLHLKDGVDKNKAQELLDLVNQKINQLDKLEGELQPYLDKNEKGESYIKNENSDKVNEILAKQKQLIEERNKIVESSKSLGGDAGKLQKFYDDHKEDYEEIAFLSSKLNIVSKDKGFADLKSIKYTIDNLDINLRENPQYSVVSGGGYSGAYSAAKLKEDEWNAYLKKSAKEDNILESTVKTIFTANKNIGEGFIQTYNVIESVFTDDSNTWDEVDANMQNTQFRKTRWSEMAVNPYLEEYSGMWWYSNAISQVPNLVYNVGASMSFGAAGVITYNFLVMEGDMVKQFEDAGYDKGLAMLYGTLTAGTLASIEALVPELPDAVGITIKKNSAQIISRGLADGLSAQQISKALLANAYEITRNAGFKVFSQGTKEAGEEITSGVVESTIMNLAEIKNDTLPEAAKEVLVQGAIGALIGTASASIATTAEVISEKTDKTAGLKFMQLEVGKNGKEILAQAEKRNADVKETDQYKDFQKVNNTYKELERVIPFKKAGDLAKAEILDLYIQKGKLVQATKEAEKLGIVDVESTAKIEELDNKILTAFNADQKRRQSSDVLVNSLSELGVVSYSMNQDGTVKEVNFAPEVSGGMVEENLPKAKELINAQLLKAREQANKQKDEEEKVKPVEENKDQDIADLRAREQEDLRNAIPDIDNYSDTKGDTQGSMPDDLYAIYKPIYDKYDALITPLLREVKSEQTPGTETNTPEIVRDEAWDENAIANLPESSFPDRNSFIETIKNGVFGLLTAWNPQRKSLSDEENAKRNEAAKSWLEERGYSTDGAFGKYGNSELSFFVPNLSREDAVAFAIEFDQESVAAHDGLVFQDGSYHPRIKGAEKFESQGDNYSTMNVAGEKVDFAIEYDFDTLLDKDGNKIETSNEENVQPTTDDILNQANTTGYNVSDNNRAKELAKVAKTPTQKRVVAQVVKALKTLKSVLPNFNIIVFDNESDFKNYANSVGANADSRGLFTILPGEETGVIAINLESANLRTVAHEMTHALLFKMFGDKPELYAQFKNKIADLAKGKKLIALDKDGVPFEISIDEIAADLASNEEYSDVERAEEYVSEVTALLSQLKESDPANKSFLKSIAEYINQLIAKYFGPDLKPIDDTSSPEEIMEFFQTFASKVYYGQKIKLDNKFAENVNTSDEVKSKYSLGGNFEANLIPASDLKKLEDEGYLVQNAKIEELEGEVVISMFPDNKMVGDLSYGTYDKDTEVDGVKYKKGDKRVVLEGNGGLHFAIKYNKDGTFWASTPKMSKTFINLVNKIFDKYPGKPVRVVVFKSTDLKVLSSRDGMAAAIDILELAVQDGDIPLSVFRNALNTAVKEEKDNEGIKLFSGKLSAKELHSVIKDYFINSNDETFKKRVDVGKKIIAEIFKSNEIDFSSLSKKLNIPLNKSGKITVDAATKRLGNVQEEGFMENAPIESAVAYIEIPSKLIVEDESDIPAKKRKHISYPGVMKTEDGQRVTVHMLSERKNYKDILSSVKDGEVRTSEKIENDNTPLRDLEYAANFAGARNIPYSVVRINTGIKYKAQVKSQIDDTQRAVLNEVFEQNPELKSIGTVEKYAEYLKNIFPKSLLQNIFYRGSENSDMIEAEDLDPEKGTGAKNLGKGLYWTLNKNKSADYTGGGKGRISAAILNVNNFHVVDIDANWRRGYAGLKELTVSKVTNGADAIIAYKGLDKDNYVDFKTEGENNTYIGEYVGPVDENGLPAYQKFNELTPEMDQIAVDSNKQVHVLGSKKDTEGFKNFVSKSQVKSLVDNAKLTKHMTEDDQGNYLFYHYSPNKISSIDPKYFGKNTSRTGKDERPGLNISMYYTRPDVLDVSGKYGYVVRIPKDNVYPFNEDPLNLYDAAKATFEKMYPGQAFDPNKQAAFIAQEAANLGYPMIVVKWGEDLRAETTEKMKGEFYQRPDKDYPSSIEFNPALEMFEANEVLAEKNKTSTGKSENITTKLQMNNSDKLEYSLLLDESADKVRKGAGILNTVNDLIAKARKIKGFRDMSSWKKREFEENIERDLKNKLAEDIATVAKIYSEMDNSSKAIAIEKAFADATRDGMEFFTVDELKDAVNAQWDKINKAELKAKRGDEKPDVFKLKEKLKELRTELSQTKENIKQAKADEKNKRNSFRYFVKEYLKLAKLSGLNSQQISAIVNRATGAVTSLTDKQIDNFIQYVDKIVANKEFAAKMDALASNRKTALKRRHNEFTEDVLRFVSIPLFDTDNNPLLTDAEMDRYLDAVARLAKPVPDHTGLDMSLADKAFSADLGKKEFLPADYFDLLTDIKSMPIDTLEEYTAFVRSVNKAKRILDSLYNQGLIDAATHEQWASGDLYTMENGLRVYEANHQDQIDTLKEGLTDDLFQKISSITTNDLFVGEQKSLFERLRSLSANELMNLDVKDLLKLNEALDRMEYGFMPEKEVREMVNRVEIRSQEAGLRIVNQLGDIYKKLTKGVNLLLRKLSSEEAAQWEDVLGLKEGDALYQYVVAPIDRSFKKMSDKVNQILDSYYKKTADLSFANRKFLFLKDRVKTAKGSVSAKKYFKHRVGILSHILDSGHKAYQYNENTNDWLGNQLKEDSIERAIYDEEGVLNIVEDVYNNLISNPAFVTNGKLDYRKIYEAYLNDPSSLMSESEQKLYSAFREANRTSGELIINANAVRGVNGELTEFFSPRRYIGKGMSEDSNVELGYGGAVGGTVRSQSSYSRVSKDPAGPLQFNVDSLVANNAFESARDFYISNAISYVNEVFKNAREAARAEGRDADVKTLNALQQSNRNRVDHQLSRSANNFLTKLTKSFAAKLLIGIGRTAAETLTNIGSGIFRTLSLRGFDPKSYREAKNLMEKFGSPVANLNWDFKVKVTTKKGNLTKNTFSQQLENSIASLHNLTAPLTPGEWMSYFRSEFKRLTGEDYSEAKHFDDSDYKYDLDRAASFADQRIQSIKGGSFKGQARANYRWLPDLFSIPKMALTGKGSKSDVSKGLVSSNDTVAQMLNLFNNFVYRDVSNMLYGAKRAGRGITKDDRMNKGADLGRGLFKFATSATSLTMYTVIFAAVKGIERAFFSDDDKEKKKGEETLEMFTNPDKMWKMIASMGINLAANVTTSRYGASGRAMAISLLQFARNMKGAERQPIDEVLQSLYFTEGIDFEKYDAVEKYAALAFATSVPPVYMLMQEAQKLYKDYLDEPGHNKATIYDLWEEGGKLFNEETADLNKMLSATIMATNLILAMDGKQIPFSRDFIKSLQDEVAIQQDVVILSSDGKYNLVAGVLNFDQNGVGVLSVQDNSKFVSAEKRKERSEALTQEATSMFKNYIQDELKNNRYALKDRNDEGKYAVIKFLAEKAKFDAKKKLKYDVDPADYPKLNFENLTFLDDVALGKFLEGFSKEEYDQEVSDYITKSIETDTDYSKYEASEAGGQQALERYYYDLYQYNKKLTNVKPIKTNYFKIIDNKIESK